MFAGPLAHGADLRDVSRAAKALPQAQGPLAPPDLLLDGLATLITEGRTAAAPMLRRAVDAFRDEEISVEKELQWGVLASSVGRPLGLRQLAGDHYRSGRSCSRRRCLRA